MRRPLILSISLALPLLAPGCGSGHESYAAAHGSPPDIILISIDTLRRDHVGLYGYERNTTPNLDRLADECVVFEEACATASWTLPSHMTMLTGLYPGQHEVINTESALNESFPTLTQRLKERGYYTIGLYRPGWLDPRYGFDRGFDTYVSHKLAHEAEANLREALANREPDKPLFLFIHLFDVHCEDLKHTEGTMYAPPAPYDELFTTNPEETLAGLDMFRLWTEPKGKDTLKIISKEQRDALIGLYDGGIRYVDDEIAGWIEELREEEVFDDAIFIVTADHGEGLAQRYARWGGHGDLHEEGLAVPLLIRFPEARWAGKRVSQRVSHVDLLPTVLDWLGAYDPRLPGVSLLEEVDEERIVIAEMGPEAVYEGRWKLLDNPPSNGGILYDLEKDPLELHPIFAQDETPEERAVRARLQAALRELRESWFEPGSAKAAEAESAATRAELEKLGYAGGNEGR